MKIPTQQNNVKRAALVVTGMAVVTGLAIPTATFAMSGSGHMDKNSSWHHNDKSSGNMDKKWDWGESWLNQISAEDFTNWNSAKLAKIDSFIAKNNLQVENQDTLRAAVDSNATLVANNLASLSDLRSSIGDIKNATDEQRASLKEQSVATFSAYYDYKMSLYDYTAAIKTAADNKGASIDSSIDEDSQ